LKKNMTASMAIRMKMLPTKGITAVTVISCSLPMSPTTRTVRSPLRALPW
jgi:hypothetical protein